MTSKFPKPFYRTARKARALLARAHASLAGHGSPSNRAFAVYTAAEMAAGTEPDRALELFRAEHLPCLVLGLDAAVGIEEEEIAGGQLDARFGVAAAREQPDRQA